MGNVLAACSFQLWWNTEVRAPIREDLLRPPGESLRRQLEDFDEGIVIWLALYTMGFAAVLVLPSQSPTAPSRLKIAGRRLEVLLELGLWMIRIV
jgi:hypothetical protein